ncbi:MAG TPA: hypothetical protein VLA72_11515 [Anaerolineales bacterium]|nr:hypothetical protein [Anaerolineales bacterium]
MLLSTALDTLYEKVQELGKQKYWFLVLVLVFVVITLINGLGIVPEEPYQRLAENPFTTRTDIHFRNNFQETLLLPIIAFFLRLTTPLTFNLLCYLIIAFAYAIFAGYTHRRWGSSEALIFSIILITSPLTTILFTWLGMPDGLTIALIIPLLFTNSAVLIFLVAALGATNHIVFLIAAGQIIVLRWISRNAIKLQHFIAAIVGGITGVLLVNAFHSYYQIEVAPRSAFILTRSILDWTKLNSVHLPLSLFSLFNFQWLAIFVGFFMFFKWDRKFYTAVSVILVLNYGVTFLSLDTTRIFILLSSGTFMLCLFHSHKLAIKHPSTSPLHQKQFLQALLLIGMISIIAPRYFSWAGEIHGTPFYEFMRQLIR